MALVPGVRERMTVPLALAPGLTLNSSVAAGSFWGVLRGPEEMRVLPEILAGLGGGGILGSRVPERLPLLIWLSLWAMSVRALRSAVLILNLPLPVKEPSGWRLKTKSPSPDFSMLRRLFLSVRESLERRASMEPVCWRRSP